MRKVFKVAFFHNGKLPSVRTFFASSGENLIEVLREQWVTEIKTQSISSSIYINADNVNALLKEIDPNFLFACTGLIETYFTFKMEILPYGKGIARSSIQTKTNESYTVHSDFPFDEIKDTILRNLNSSDSCILVRNESPKNPALCVKVESIHDLLQCMENPATNKRILYVLELHAPYSHIVFPQISNFLEFPQNPEISSLASHHHTTLTSIIPSVDHDINQAIAHAKRRFPCSSESDEMYKATNLAVAMLQLICDNSAPKESFNEKLRRSIIDIPLHIALGVVNKEGIVRRELMMEEELFPTEVNSDEIVGSGLFDYLLPEGIVVTQGTFSEDAISADVEEEDIEESDDDMVNIESFPVIYDDEDKCLFQILAQLHDCMYVHEEAVIPNDPRRGRKRALTDDPITKGKLALCRERALGILTTGHRWQVFSIRKQKDSSKLAVNYHGEKQMKVLRYLASATSCTSSFKASTKHDMIDRNEIQEVIYLIIAVVLNLFP